MMLLKRFSSISWANTRKIIEGRNPSVTVSRDWAKFIFILLEIEHWNKCRRVIGRQAIETTEILSEAEAV
ncbi:hypothetical protein D3C72_2573440 [compost metagenome]